MQKYEFDRLDYLVLPRFLTPTATRTLATASDAILFTEHLCHGGKSIKSDRTRKTLHVG